MAFGLKNITPDQLINIDPENEVPGFHNWDTGRQGKFINLQKKTREFLKNSATPIRLIPGEMHEVANHAEKILIQQDLGIYQRGGQLVRIISDVFRPKRKTLLDRSGNPIIKRSPEALVIVEVDSIYLTELLGKHASWIKYDERKRVWIRKDCPEKISKTLIARREWNLRILSGVIHAPTLRADGSILEHQGYDEITGLFFHPGDILFSPIPQNPTKDEACNALKMIIDLLKDFPFANDESKSVSISAILTALIRKSIRTAPLHGFTAPKMGSGKTLLADVVGLIATGKENSVIPQASDETEEKKRLLAVLAEGDPIICYDNIERPFGSAALCSVLSQEHYKDRLLGQNRNLTVPTNSTFLATGNNLVFIGDISTRSIICSLDPECEHPEEREFEIDLRKYIPEHRADLVKAGLTILRAYHVAGRPKQNIKQFGRFEEWSDWVRSALVWLDMEDPCASRKEIENTDPTREELRNLLLIWFDIFDNMSIRVDSLIKKALEETEKGQILKEILLNISSKGLNSRSIGKYLSSVKNRIENGLRLEVAGEECRYTLWRVKKML